MPVISSQNCEHPNSASLRCLIESLEQILFLLTPDMREILYVSPAYERVTGYPRQTVYDDPMGWAKLIHEEDRPDVQATVNKRSTGELTGRSELEFRILTASGEVRWLRSIITPVHDESGNVLHLTGFSEDITERKQADLALREVQAELSRKVALRTEELSELVIRLQEGIEQRKEIEAELRRSESRQRRFFEANIIGVIFTDIYGHMSDANDAFLAMIGYDRADLPLRWDNMTPPEWSHTDRLSVKQLLETGSSPAYEKEYIRKDGTRAPVLIGNALLDSESGGCVSFVLDLTGRKDAEEQIREVNVQLEHASRLGALGEIVADMAHEIHQPLGAIANYADGTLLRIEHGELKIGPLKARLREITHEALRVADVLRRIREFIQRRTPERIETDLNRVILDALQFTRLDRHKNAVSVFFQPDGSLPTALADRVQITQVLVNLLLNSVAAVSTLERHTGKILVSTYLNDDDAQEIQVSDNGTGIPGEVHSRIFERFFTTKPTGLGLGLAISRSIIESHGGRLWCASAGGESAIFRLTLPRFQPGVSGEQPPAVHAAGEHASVNRSATG